MSLAQIAQVLRESSPNFAGVSDGVVLGMAVVVALLLIASLVALLISIILGISYIKYNRTQNSLGMSGRDIARKVLDDHELQGIKVKATGSILFGNSYSHFFKKVRLRRLTWKKSSVASLAMAVQKSALAILDKENDPDMVARRRLAPVIYFGPWFFVPLVVVGAVLDIWVYPQSNGTFTMALSVVGLVFYLLSFLMSLRVLKTEKKAQQRALELMERDGLATPEERAMCKKLFRLYNIEYVNNMVIALLELIYRVLQIIAYVQSSKSTSSSQ